MRWRRYVAADPLDIHVINGYDCWCAPRFYLPCDECGDLDSWERVTEDAKRVHARPKDLGVTKSCWKCVNQLIELTRDEAEACAEPVLIVHNEPN
jgi:hypothetical protein